MLTDTKLLYLEISYNISPDFHIDMTIILSLLVCIIDFHVVAKGHSVRINFPDDQPDVKILSQSFGVPSTPLIELQMGAEFVKEAVAQGFAVFDSVHWDEENKALVGTRDDPHNGDGHFITVRRVLVGDGNTMIATYTSRNKKSGKECTAELTLQRQSD